MVGSGDFRRRLGQRGQGRGLRHPPALTDEHAVALLVLLHHPKRDGGTTAAQRSLSEEMSRLGIGVQILQYVVPDRGHRRGYGRPMPFDHVDQGFGLQEAVGQQKIGARHHRGVWLTPRVGVEHRHDRKHPVTVKRDQGCLPHRMPSSAGSSTGGCRRRLSDSLSCRWCNTLRRRFFHRDRASRTRSVDPSSRSS